MKQSDGEKQAPNFRKTALTKVGSFTPAKKNCVIAPPAAKGQKQSGGK